jgi:2-hydroxycyclohexanecarboxyl-CoA dehydrogenase
VTGPVELAAEAPTGRVVVVTGGASGLGRSHVEAFAAAGDRVVVVDLDGHRAEQVAAALPGALGVGLDVTDEAAVAALMARVAAELGGLDVLVCSAGGVIGGPGDETCPPEVWRRTIDVNLTGTWLCAQAAVPLLATRGGGRIVATISDTVFRPVPGMAIPYVASKAGIIGMVRGLALAVGDRAITVNAVAPGFTRHPDQDRFAETAVLDEMAAFAESGQSIRRPGTPADITGAVLYLASAAAGFVTGQVITVDGGWSWPS